MQNVRGIEEYLAQAPDVVVAYLFGSVARDQATAGSDFDIAVLLDPTLTPLAQVERQLELMLALDELTPLPTQVTLLNNAPPVLAFNVIRDGRLLHQRSQAERVAFEVRTMQIYHDLKPVLDAFNARFLERTKENGLAQRSRYSSRTLEAAQQLYERFKAAAEH